jgi:hypothetical protein
VERLRVELRRKLSDLALVEHMRPAFEPLADPNNAPNASALRRQPVERSP